MEPEVTSNSDEIAIEFQSTFRCPTFEERTNKADLIGRRIEIFWDGDNVYYPASVKSYDVETGVFHVKYENDPGGDDYEENLDSTNWNIWDGPITQETLVNNKTYAERFHEKKYFFISCCPMVFKIYRMNFRLMQFQIKLKE